MTPTPGITALLRHARLVALEEFSGQRATEEVRLAVAECIRTTILRQVIAGLWKEYAITDHRQLEHLRVSVQFGNTLIGEPPLKIEWDFSRTALPLLVVSNDKPERST